MGHENVFRRMVIGASIAVSENGRHLDIAQTPGFPIYRGFI